MIPGCPYNWTYFENVNKCLWHSNNDVKNWSDSEADCKFRSDNVGYLAEPKDQNLADILSDFTFDNRDKCTYIVFLLLIKKIIQYPLAFGSNALGV